MRALKFAFEPPRVIDQTMEAVATRTRSAQKRKARLNCSHAEAEVHTTVPERKRKRAEAPARAPKRPRRETSDQDALERIVEAAFKVPDDGSAVSYLRKVLLRSAFEIARRADIAEANYKRVKLEIEKKDDELKRVRLLLTASKKHVRWATEARGRYSFFDGGSPLMYAGNDAGEKLSILPGILAKMDRDAPSYGSSTYNDFNTFYYAAASSTSGGSSGSPVLNIDGCAIALNAGEAKKAASSFYLPLDRVGKPAPRGTIQTIFRHTAFDEMRRLGLPGETEALYGATFLTVEEYLDAHVGETVEAQFQHGDEQYTATISIQDLHSITPDRYLEIGGGIVHALSYQQARNASLPVGGVYLAQAGHMFMKVYLAQPCIITSVAGQPTPTLNDFARVMASLPNGFRTVLRYFMIRDRHRVRTAFIMMDRLWFPMQMCTRNDEDGLWYSKPYTLEASNGENSLVATANGNPTFALALLSFPGGNALGKKTLLSLVMARSGLGLSDAWIPKLESCFEDKRQVLGIKRCAAGTDCAEKLESGDLWPS
ncbi:hypothetical protein PPTG_23638 [Phytophthora nicotianae INRA-310]|uniref:PDZ-like domain-containing protein n=1 Tax=Phytophthora nicotianae (strain INRA-310) TaxID=761204 RepID=W2PU96_PHYN3|nr:hypothetical protein PPTG_23638 [Phytophthora nicotianae INRA-310]ETN04196.1 hypothetical protein PPTG_23638 [Phytophthora nicotianae INRA-310]